MEHDRLDATPVARAERVEAQFVTRTCHHIALVAANLARIARGRIDASSAAALAERARWHDASKFAAPERDGYIELTEWHRSRNAPRTGERPYEYPPGMAERVAEAIRHHKGCNAHHVEFFDSPDDMDALSVAEMVADWAAIAQETTCDALCSPRQWYTSSGVHMWVMSASMRARVEAVMGELETALAAEAASLASLPALFGALVDAPTMQVIAGECVRTVAPALSAPNARVDDWRLGAGARAVACAPVLEHAEAPAPGRDMAALLVASMRAGERLPLWAHELDFAEPLPVPPPALEAFCAAIASDGVAAANALMYEPTLVPVPACAHAILSGDSTRAVRFREWQVGAFFASLFHAIEGSSPVRVRLAGWDLSHAHLVAIAPPTSDSAGDLALIFHAREFPHEARVGPVAGTAADPRQGSLCSLHDDDASARNYVWTLRSRRVALIDGSAGAVARGLVSAFQARFGTLNETLFGAQALGSINFLPWLPSGDAPVPTARGEPSGDALVPTACGEPSGDALVPTACGEPSGDAPVHTACGARAGSQGDELSARSACENGSASVRADGSWRDATRVNGEGGPT